MDFSKDDLMPFITFKASRSGGKGGQNVNKVSSKVELNFDLAGTSLFSDAEKERIKTKLAGRLTAEGLIQVVAKEERSQLFNKERSVEKLYHLLRNALHVHKPRRATKPTKASVERRLQGKQQQALKKINRKRLF